MFVVVKKGEERGFKFGNEVLSGGFACSKSLVDFFALLKAQG